MKNKTFYFGLYGASLLTLGAIAAQADVVINEALASNNSYYYESSTDAYDWIELYNTGAEAVDLTGMQLTLASGKSFTFPSGTIAASACYQVLCDSGLDSSATNTGFNLPASGDTINLYNASGTAIDSLDYGQQVTDYSVGRYPDGTGSFTLCVPTQAAANTAQATASQAFLKINECCAGPDDWFEVYNSATTPVALGGCHFTTKPSKDPTMFEIPALTFIGTGADAYLVFYADKDTTAGKDHVNFKLSKSSDDVAITTSSGSLINAFEYPDMEDYDVYGRIPDGANNIVEQPTNGTPAASNYLELTSVVISEIFTHSDYDEGTTDPDFIELQNISSATVDISGWGLSDNAKNFKKYIFPDGSTIAAGEFLTITELEFNDESNANCQETFRLNSYEGDSTYLTQIVSSTATGYRSQVTFGAAPNNYSFVRYENTDGDIDYPLSEYTTMGATNAPVIIGPIVINEIHYKPAGTTEPVEDEFIEIFNITDEEVAMYYSTNPDDAAMISNGVEYIFPAGMTLAAGAYALVVSFDPDEDTDTAATFRSTFNVPDDVVLYGPYSGKLSNDGETIELLFPDKPEGDDSDEPGMIPYYLVDKVSYTDSTPWPTDAKGTGKSLQKNNAFSYGNQSGSWSTYQSTDTSCYTSAGYRSTIGVTDQDSDQMPDDWELTYQLDPFDASDADEDANNDGITNLQHYLNRTDPTATTTESNPVTLSIAISSSTATISFTTEANFAYEVQKATSLSSEWTTWETVEAGTARTVELTDTVSTDSPCFYRVLNK